MRCQKKNLKKLKIKIRLFYGTGIDFYFFHAKYGVGKLFLALMSLNEVFLRLNKSVKINAKIGGQRHILRFKFYVTLGN